MDPLLILCYSDWLRYLPAARFSKIKKVTEKGSCFTE